MKYFRSKTDKFISLMIIFLLFIFLLIELYPLYFVLIASISNPALVASNKIVLVPRQITFEGYKNIYNFRDIWIGYGNSFVYAIIGTLINLSFTLSCSYCMARVPAFKGKTIITTFFIFTMYFSGGLIPFYLLIKDLNWIDNRAVMVIPGALSVFNMIIVRTFYQSTIPHSIYESVRIDGCDDIRSFLKITLPLSKPIIAVMTLFFAVGHWNSYFGALIFLPSINKQPLQLVLRRLLVLGEVLRNMDLSSLSSSELEYWVQRVAMAESMKYAVIYVASLPVLIAYPFVQKYFVKGIMIGALKG